MWHLSVFSYDRGHLKKYPEDSFKKKIIFMCVYFAIFLSIKKKKGNEMKLWIVPVFFWFCLKKKKKNDFIIFNVNLCSNSTLLVM